MRTANANNTEIRYDTLSEWDSFTVGTSGHGVAKNELLEDRYYPVPKGRLSQGSESQGYVNLKRAKKESGLVLTGENLLTNVDFNNKKGSHKPTKFCAEGVIDGKRVRIYASESNTKYAVKIGSGWVTYRNPFILKRKLQDG